jgi:hypothetical protein
MCRLSRNLRASTSWNPKGLSKRVMGLLFTSVIGQQRNSWLKAEREFGFRKFPPLVSFLFHWLAASYLCHCKERQCTSRLRLWSSISGMDILDNPHEQCRLLPYWLPDGDNKHPGCVRLRQGSGTQRSSLLHIVTRCPGNTSRSVDKKKMSIMVPKYKTNREVNYHELNKQIKSLINKPNKLRKNAIFYVLSDKNLHFYLKF